ncbi:MAG: PAC2 family protein [bacterium]
MEHLHFEKIPSLRNPTLLLAFAGWNDASSSATTTATFISKELGGREFASIESDPFYNFQDMRPHVSLDEAGRRKITWPSNTFFACETPQLSHDVIVFVGEEPHLQWRQFARHVISLTQRCDVGLAVTLGALLADVHHKSEVRITGSSTNSVLARRLGLQSSRYEGPTGIVGVLNNLFQEENVPTVSVWANVPHYVNVTPNPRASLALVRRLSEFFSFSFNLTDLEMGAQDFDEKVDQALEANKAVRDYVEELRQRSEEEEEEESAKPLGELPSGDTLASELERFLRKRRSGESEESGEDSEDGENN